MNLADPNASYADRAVEHTAQGDIYAGIPLVQATRTDPSFAAAGARKRPGGPDPEHASHVTYVGLAVVMHYTCGITAQPPGTVGYSHEYRLMAPIIGLRELRRWGMGNNELRKIRDGRTIQGLMYLPQIGAVQHDEPGDDEDEWTGHAAALIYRPASVTQALLEAPPRPRAALVVVSASGPRSRLGVVPTISRFYGIVIRMYFSDHAPPHFHAVYSGEEAVIAIESGEVIRGGLPERALRLVREWQSIHHDELVANWARVQVPVLPQKIDPLP